MWVSKGKWDAMTKRLDDLERRVGHASNEHYFTVYKKVVREKNDEGTFVDQGGYYYWMGGGCPLPPSKSIPVKDVIESILKKLGMELVYVNGEPARVEIKKAKGS
jgi:hypothetical protein